MRVLRWINEHLVQILAVVAPLALFLATFAVVQSTRAQADRIQERQVFDQQSCERGNVFRKQIVAIGQADEQLLRDLLQELIGKRATTDAARAQVAELLLRLEPSFDKQEAAVAAIELTNCSAALDLAKKENQ